MEDKKAKKKKKKPRRFGDENTPPNFPVGSKQGQGHPLQGEEPRLTPRVGTPKPRCQPRTFRPIREFQFQSHYNNGPENTHGSGPSTQTISNQIYHRGNGGVGEYSQTPRFIWRNELQHLQMGRVEPPKRRESVRVVPAMQKPGTQEMAPRICLAMQPIWPPLNIPTQRYRTLITNPPHPWRLLLLFGVDGTHRGYITARIVETYGFVRISIMQIFQIILANRNHPNFSIVSQCLSREVAPPPEVTCDLILKIMNTSPVKNFIIDDFPVDKYYLFELTHSVAPFAKIPFVLVLKCDIELAVQRCLQGHFGQIHPLKLRNFIIHYQECLEEFLLYYQDMRMVRAFDSRLEAEMLFLEIRKVLDPAVLRGEFIKYDMMRSSRPPPGYRY